MRIRLDKITALFLAIALILPADPLPVRAQLLQPGTSAGEGPSAVSAIHLSPAHGTLESMTPGTGPVIFHIQEAHGSFEVQQNILELLRELKKEFGVQLVFLEGSAFPLDRELLRYAPENRLLEQEVLDVLARKSLISGPELFLLEDDTVEAYGIESTGAYTHNGKAFRDVTTLRQSICRLSA